MGRKSRTKGRHYELEVVHAHEPIGVPCRRTQHAGMSQDDAPDLLVGDVLHAECKRRARGFATLYKMLGDHDLLFVRDDQHGTLVVQPWDTYVALITCWHESGCPTSWVPLPKESE
mgnify:CR=1 FL=1